MTNQTLSNDLVRKFGFTYAHNGKTNILICLDCERLYKDLQDKIASEVENKLCEFFDDCAERKGQDGNRGKPKNG